MPAASSRSGLQVAHTADLNTSILDAAHALLHGVFGDELTDHDWEHALGGMHALVWEDGDLVGHASVIQRRLLHGGRALRTGFVEAVGVRADRQRRGLGSAMMDELERIVRGAYELGALGATDAGAAFYAARGWQVWQGSTWALTPGDRFRTEGADGAIFVLPVSAALDLTGELTGDWRDGEVW